MGFINLGSGAAGGGGATWGTIGGTLSNQVDLQNALNAKISNVGPQTITGDFTVDGKLTVTGIIDPTQIQFSSLVDTSDITKYEIGHDGGTVMYYNVPVGSTMDFRIGGVSKFNVNTSGYITLVGDPLAALGAATKQYVDASVVGLLDDRGNFDASVNLYPSTGGSGTAGAILKGDIWYISVAGTLGANPVLVGYSVRAITNAPGQTDANWDILNVGLGYVPENVANKATTFGTLNNTLYPSTLAVSNFVVSATAVTAGEIAFGGVGNTLTSSASLLWNDTTKDFSASGVIGISLANSNNVFYVAQGNVGYWFTGAASTGLLSHQGFGIDMKTTEKYTMGAVGLGNNSYIEVNDTAQTTTISNLSGVGTRMVTADATGILGSAAIPLGTVTSVSGTANRITSTGGTTPVIDIDAAYVGQTSITTLGTITTGTWNGTAIANANLANSTISGVSLGSNLFALTIGTGLSGISYDGSAPITIAIDSSVVTLTGAQALSNKTGLISQWTNDSGYALDSAVVHLAGAENITGSKTFLTGAVTTFDSGTTTAFNGSLAVTDTLFTIKNSVDGTKQGSFSSANIPTLTTLVYGLPSTAGTLVLSVNGNTADAAGDVTVSMAASTVSIVDDTTTNAVMYPTWVTANTGSLPLKVSSTKFSFNPSTASLGIGISTPTANLNVVQAATATGALKGIVYTGAINTNQTLSTEIPSVTITTAGRQWATGALTTQREVLITQPTYSFVGASTITTSATFTIAGAPISGTNTTQTTTQALLVQAGAVTSAGTSYGATINAQTGGTLNFAAQFVGADIFINTLRAGKGLAGVATNTAFGFEALNSNTSGSLNTAIGYQALKANTVGSSNTAVGRIALTSNTSGDSNTGIGTSALNTNTTGGSNTAVGFNSLGTNNASNNTAIGWWAMAANTSGTSNVAVGYSALILNTTGGTNTAVGYNSMVTNVSGGSNSAFGDRSLRLNTASFNSAFGEQALGGNGVGDSNNAFGRVALLANTSGTSNCAFGRSSLELNTIGTNNSAYGSSSGYGLTTGVFNTFIGSAAGLTTGNGITTGNYNTIIGASVTNLSSSLSNNIILADGQGNIRLQFASTGVGTTTGASVQTNGVNSRATENKLLKRDTTDATVTELTTDGAAGSGSANRISVPANTTLSVVMNVSVKQSGSANSKQMLRQFVITNNAGTTAIEGTVIALGTDSGSAALATVAVTVTANDTDDCIKIEGTGLAATNLRWTAYVVSTEVTY